MPVTSSLIAQSTELSIFLLCLMDRTYDSSSSHTLLPYSLPNSQIKYKFLLLLLLLLLLLRHSSLPAVLKQCFTSLVGDVRPPCPLCTTECLQPELSQCRNADQCDGKTLRLSLHLTNERPDISLHLTNERTDIWCQQNAIIRFIITLLHTHSPHVMILLIAATFNIISY